MVLYGSVGTKVAGVVAGVGLTADTEISVNVTKFSEASTIRRITWGFGNVVNAKAATGYLELKSTLQQGPWRFPVGLGAGGATDSSNQHRGQLDVNIPVKVNEEITIYMTMNENCVAGHAGLEYKPGRSGKTTYMDCNTAEDAAVTAATRESPGSVTIPQDKGGVINKIFVNYADVVDAKTAAGYVELIPGKTGGEFLYTVGGGQGGAATSSIKMNAEEIETEIPIKNNEIVEFWYYFTDAKVNAHVGIQWS